MVRLVCDGRIAPSGLVVVALVDSGASVCVVSDTFASKHSLLRTCIEPVLLRTACGRRVAARTMVWLSFLVNDRMYRMPFLVVPSLMDPLILGRDFLRTFGLCLHVAGGRLDGKGANALKGLSLGPLARFDTALIPSCFGCPPPHGVEQVPNVFADVCTSSAPVSLDGLGPPRAPVTHSIADWVHPVALCPLGPPKW